MSMRDHSSLKDLITLAHGVAREIVKKMWERHRFLLEGIKKLNMHVKDTNNHTRKVCGFLSER